MSIGQADPRRLRRHLAVAFTLALVGIGGFSTVSVRAAEGVPSAPTNVRWFVAQNNQVELTWVVPTGGVPLSGYAVYRNGVEIPFAVLTPAMGNEVRVGLASQPAGRDLYFQVQAIATTGLRSVKTAPVVVNIRTRPTVPTSLVVTLQANGQPKLSWTASTDPSGGQITYLVYRNGVLLRTETGTTSSLSGEPVAVDLYYQVQARDQQDGLSVKTPPVLIRLAGADTVRPTIPTNVQPILRLNATVEVTWSASTDNVGVAGYIVFVNGTEAARTTDLSVRLLNQPRGVTLGYQVQAYDAAGNLSTKTLPVYLAF
jgi:hypothetical protein